ncbi:MAG: ABC transporter permease [Streptosporangiaceae bacterium]|nr:ABC transporter permease [Streptosporangiaceae bacterium]
MSAAAGGPGQFSTASLVVHQARYDLRVFRRDPRARGFTLALPVLLLVLFGSIFRHDSFTYAGVTIPGDAYYAPRMIVLGLTGASLSNLLINLVSKRETGALKRRRATPVRPIVLIGGDLATAVVSALSIAIVLTLIAWIAFSTHPGGAGLLAALLAVVVGAIALGSVAYALSPFVPSVDAAGPLTMLVMFAVNAISGIYVPENLFPQWIRDVAQVLPIRPLAVAMQSAFDPATNGGRTFAWSDLGIVLIWGVAAAAFAVRRFVWTPTQQ